MENSTAGNAPQLSRAVARRASKSTAVPAA